MAKNPFGRNARGAADADDRTESGGAPLSAAEQTDAEQLARDASARAAAGEELNDEEKAAIERAHKMAAEKSALVGGHAEKHSDALELLREGEEVVTVMVPLKLGADGKPTPVRYRPDHHRIVLLHPGVCRVPAHVADHWFVKGSGVVRVGVA